MNSGIYKITNKVNGKLYIGSTNNFSTRWRNHKHNLLKNKHCNRYLQSSVNKYGLANFEFSKCLICSSDDCVFYEQLFLDFFKPEYNLAKNAKTSRVGIKNSLKHRKQISDNRLDDLKGRRFGTRLVLEKTSRQGERLVRWRIKCDCGREDIVSSSAIKRSKTCPTCSSKRIVRLQAKLDVKKIKDIKIRLRNGESCSSIAKDYVVCSTTISSIKRGKTWNDVLLC